MLATKNTKNGHFYSLIQAGLFLNVRRFFIINHKIHIPWDKYLCIPPCHLLRLPAFAIIFFVQRSLLTYCFKEIPKLNKRATQATRKNKR